MQRVHIFACIGSVRLRNLPPLLRSLAGGLNRQGHSVFFGASLSKFCDYSDLLNEAAVENLFATPLIRDLGYANSQVRFKDAITPVEVSQGRRTSVYRPDYILSYRGKPRVVIDAKGPAEDLLSWVGQATSYCLMLNRQFEGENPVRYFVLTSGRRTVLYEWDEGLALLDISFDEMTDSNPKFTRLKELLRPSATMPRQSGAAPQHRFHRRSVPDVNAAFSWCHEHIYKNDHMSQAAGFTEFVKLIFLKLLSDRAIRDTYGDLVWQESFDVPAADVRFSVRWINEREADAVSPVDALQFRQLVATLEGEIAAGTRKRIFEANAQIRLSAETIKAVVKKLEGTFLFGIDIDLNGRLFETFLSATMRGKDLGQFFTPRSVVKLGTRMGAPVVSREHIDKVVDGCCGTGGFLIDALADMWNTIDSNPTYSATERRDLRRLVANDALYGMDIGKDPNQARLARMNMYLHGDGGTSIFETDFLDKRVTFNEIEGLEVQLQSNQLRAILEGSPDNFLTLFLQIRLSQKSTLGQIPYRSRFLMIMSLREAKRP